MKNVNPLIHTLFVRLLLVLISIIIFIPFCIIALIPEKYRWNSRTVFTLVNWLYKIILKGSLLPITYTGKENLPTKPAIFVANHQSSFDIPLLGVLPGTNPHIWLARSELMESPILRFVLPIFTIVANVTSKIAAVKSLRHIVRILQEDHKHMLIFPEGSRFSDGSIHTFFKGFVTLAKITGRPVIPVYINGVNKVYPKDSFLMHYGPIHVTVGPPFTFEKNDTDQAFNDRVRDWFLHQASLNSK